tara:strand:- start:331 stop:630 length:300 start_codon:yes stop_codon:yes gene_type:complete
VKFLKNIVISEELDDVASQYDNFEGNMQLLDLLEKLMSFAAETPFILLARIQVKPDEVQEYFLLAPKTDKAVEYSEPGMLHHSFDQDPDNPHRFVWSEV